MGVKRKITAEDLFRLEFISDPAIAPAGNEIAFVLTTMNAEKEYTSQIWLANARKEVTPFTRTSKSDTSPRWSPTGDQLAFVSNRSGERQIWQINRFGGEAQQLTRMYHGATNPVWSPAGKMIAFTSAVSAADDPACLLREKTDAEREQEKKDKTRKARVIKGLEYKSDDAGYLDDKKNHIWVVDLAGGEPRRITTSERDYSRVLWSPDGKKLLAVCEVEEGEYYPGETQILIIDVRTGAERVITSRGISANLPTWSPDGSMIAFYGHRMECKGATFARIWILDINDGSVRILGEEKDFGVGDYAVSDLRAGTSNPGPVWSLDGQSVFALVSEAGNTGIYRFALDGTVEKVIGGKRQIFGFSMDDDRQKIAFTYTTPLIPGDLAVYDLYTEKESRLTELNTAFLEEVELSEPEELIFTGADGWKIHGWVMKPAGFVDGQQYPLILEIHGGPHAMYSHSFFHEFQLLTAQGYGVIYCNPRGSVGYGQTFVDAVRGDYGGKDYEDLMAMVDLALNWSWVDKERLGITGGSYGGFMTNWAVTHTDRFKAAVTQRSISNWNSFVGVSDIGYFFGDWEHKVDFIRERDELVRISPLTYVEAVNTPLLLLHSECDYRCPLEQAEQFYVHLKYMRKIAELVIFPGSNHNLSRNGQPELRVERLNRIVEWFNRYI